jgi:hypothetical protein
MERPGDQRRDPTRRPKLILMPAAGWQTRIQCGPQPGQLLLAQSARRPPGPPDPPHRRTGSRARHEILHGQIGRETLLRAVVLWSSKCSVTC